MQSILIFCFFKISDSQLDSDDTLKLATSKPIPSAVPRTPSANLQPIAISSGSKTGIAHVIYKPEPQKIKQRPSTLNLPIGPSYFGSVLSKGKLQTIRGDAADVILDRIDSEMFSMTSMQVEITSDMECFALVKLSHVSSCSKVLLIKSLKINAHIIKGRVTV